MLTKFLPWTKRRALERYSPRDSVVGKAISDMAILTFTQTQDIAGMRSRHEYSGFKVVARLLVFLVRVNFAVL